MIKIDASACLGTHNVLFATLDTLRYDVAMEALVSNATPHFSTLLPGLAWQARHSPSSFTYGAHHAFFSGFLPTPIAPISQDKAAHDRLFAARFPGSETTASGTLVFDAPTIVEGFSDAGYHTVCVGGTGFFNKRSPLGRVLPGLFEESYWDESFGVTSTVSAASQVACMARSIGKFKPHERIFVFVNFSACHPPHHIFVEGADIDTKRTQQSGLATIDAALPTLVNALCETAPTLMIFTSDHGTAFGEDGYYGHRIGHPVVWTVPYAEFILGKGYRL